VRSIVSISCSLSLIWLLRLSLSAWESPWIFECFYAHTIWLFIRRSLHTSLHRVLFGCLSRSFSRTLSLPLSLSPFQKYACMSFSLSFWLALFRYHVYPFHPPYRLYPSVSPAFSTSLPPVQIQSPDPLFLSPTILPRFYSSSSVFVHVYPYWYMYIDTQDVIKWEWGVPEKLWIII